jgi:uncharacterized RDD family membrane protein YckC
MQVQPQLKSGLQAITFGVLGLYFVWFWRRGQTLAMKTWRIQMVDLQGQPPTFPTLFKRYVLGWVWFLPPMAASVPLRLSALEVGLLTLAWVVVWAGLSRFHPEKQFWHDAWAKTRLITVR